MTQNDLSDKRLAPGQIKAIEALLYCRSVEEACATAQVTRRTLDRWRNDPVFKAALRKAENIAIEDIGRSLLTLGNLAASALYDALQPTQKIHHRIAAAQIFYDKILALKEYNDLENRLEELENRIGDEPFIETTYTEA